MNIACPHCSKTFPYSIAARQAQTNVKFNRKILCEIIQERKKLTTGELVACYKEKTSQDIGVRLIGYFLEQLEKEQVIKRRVISLGRYGRTTHVTYSMKEIPAYLLKTPKVIPKILPNMDFVKNAEAGIGERIIYDKGRFIVTKASVGGQK